jgi:hypothetical protein
MKPFPMKPAFFIAIHKSKNYDFASHLMTHDFQIFIFLLFIPRWEGHGMLAAALAAEILGQLWFFRLKNNSGVSKEAIA